MKKHKHPIDEFFRGNLEDYKMEPSDGAKKAFLRDAMQLPPPVKKGRKGLALLLVLISLVGAGIILWTVSTDSFTKIADQASDSPAINMPSAGQKTGSSISEIPGQKNKQQQQEQEQQQEQKKQSQQTQGQKQSQQTQEQKQLQQTQHTPKQHQQNLQQPATSTQTKPLSKDTQESVQPAKDSKPDPQQPIQENPEAKDPGPPSQAFLTPQATNVNPSNISKVEVLSKADQKLADGTIPTSQTTGNQANKAPSNPAIQATSNPANQVQGDRANKAPDSALIVKREESNFKPDAGTQKKTTHERINRQNWIPDIGIYYTPEWMFNTLEGTKFVNNFGIEGTFHFGKFSVRTGAGISVGQGTNELAVEYNDFLGEYNKLDSMDFTWNDPTKEYLPTFYMSQQDVWDSLLKLDYPKVIKRYTYLQVPLVMGYDFWQSGKISVGIRIGPVMSILLATKQLSEDYDPGKKRIISINDIAPEQVSLNWQVLGGLNAAFRITEKLHIEFEPNARYYFNSVYEKPANNAKPWSIGIRAAVLLKF